MRHAKTEAACGSRGSLLHATAPRPLAYFTFPLARSLRQFSAKSFSRKSEVRRQAAVWQLLQLQLELLWQWQIAETG